MGWDYVRLNEGEDYKDFLKEELIGGLPGYFSVPALEEVDGIVYAAVKASWHDDGRDREMITARVIHMDFDNPNMPNSNFGFKIISEFEGPLVYDCPLNVLNVLTPMKDIHLTYLTEPIDGISAKQKQELKAEAQNWRDKCQNRHTHYNR